MSAVEISLGAGYFIQIHAATNWMQRSQLCTLIIVLLLLLPVFASARSEAGAAWWDERWRYRVPVNVTSAGVVTVEVDPAELQDRFFLNDTIDPLSIRVVGPAGEELPFSLSFAKEFVLSDFESGAVTYETRRALAEASHDSIQGEVALRFRIAGPREAWVAITVNTNALAQYSGVLFWAKGNFTAVLRDSSLPKVLGNLSVTSTEYRLYYIPYDPGEVVWVRQYALFLSPNDVFTPNYVDDVRLVGGTIYISWQAEEAGSHYVYFDTVGANLPPTSPAQISGPEGQATVGAPEGFAVLPELSPHSTLKGNVSVEVCVVGNLTPLRAVQMRLDYVGQTEWWDPDWGVLLDLKPEGGCRWSVEWDTAHTTWDGLHTLVIRAFEESGRMAEARVQVWVWNVENGTVIDPKRESFTFVVYGDNRPSGTARQPDAYRQLLLDINRLNPDLIFSTGDIVYSGEYREYVEFVKVTSAVRRPIFIALGNHEVSIGGRGQENYLHFFGKLFYSFDYGNTHFVVLNANVIGHLYTLSEEQIEWLRRDLEAHSNATHTFVFIHQPVYKYAHGLEDPAVEARLKEIFESYGVDCIFQGHEHMFYEGESNGVHFFITGGGGAELDPQYPAENLFFHYVVVRVDGEEVSYEVRKPLILELPAGDGDVIVVYKADYTIKGRTQPFAELQINGEEVKPTKTGLFMKKVKLRPGRNEFVVTASAGGETRTSRFAVVYLPPLEVSITPEPRPGREVEIGVKCAGQPVQGAMVELNGITAATGPGGSVSVTLPSVSEPTTVVVAAKAEGCAPYSASIKLEPKLLPWGIPPIYMAAAAIALAILAIALVALRMLRRR